MQQAPPTIVEARPCTGDEIVALTADEPVPVVLSCRATLTAGQSVTTSSGWGRPTDVTLDGCLAHGKIS